MIQQAAVRQAAPMAPVDQDALLAGLRRGEQTSYERLVREQGIFLLAVVRRLIQDEDESRDVVQEAFIQAFCSIGQFRGGSSLSTWLYRIAVNAALQRLRRSARRPETSLDALLPRFDADGRFAESMPGSLPDAEEALQRAEVRATVRRCIGRLPRAYRAVLMLRDIEEMDTLATARALGISESAVKLRLHRARQALAGLLVEAVGDPGLRREPVEAT